MRRWRWLWLLESSPLGPTSLFTAYSTGETTRAQEEEEEEELRSTKAPSGRVVEVPGQVLMLQQELIQEVMAAIPAKCENCSANNPKIKHEMDGQVCAPPAVRLRPAAVPQDTRASQRITRCGFECAENRSG